MRPSDAMFGGHDIFLRRMRVFVRKTMHQHYAKDPTDERSSDVRFSELVRETVRGNVRKNIGEKGQSVEDQLEIADFLKVIEKHPDVFPSTVRPGTTLFEALRETPPDRNDFSHATEDKSEHDAQEFLRLLSEFLKACGETGFALQIEKDYIAQLGETPPASSPASRESSGEDYIAQLGETPLASSSASHESQAPRKATAGLASKLTMSHVLVLVVGIVAAVAVVYLLALRGDTADSPQQVPAIANAEPSEGNGTTPGSSAESQQAQRAEQSDDGEPTLLEDNLGRSQPAQGAGDTAAPQQTQSQGADDPGNGGPSQHDNGDNSQPTQAVASEEQADSGSPPRQDGDGSDASTTTEIPTNRQPACDLINDLNLKIDEGNGEQIFLTDYCTNTNPDGDGWKFSASPSDDRVASLDEQPTGDRGRLSIYGEGSGTATITVTATDPSSGESAEMSFAVTVLGRIDCPIIDDVWANRGDADQAIDLNCSDPEDPERQHILTYKASSNAPDVADVSVSGSTLTISFGDPGRADVSYTATSSADGRSVSREFEVVVN